MSRLTYTRAEWETIAEVITAADRSHVPPGLAERIDVLLRDTPPQWSAEPCALELDAASAAAVQQLYTRRPEDSGSLGEAQGIIWDHQREHQAAPYRIEHWTKAGTATVAYLFDQHLLQTELGRHAARLLAGGVTGELVLVAQASRTELARRSLWPESEDRPSD